MYKLLGCCIVLACFTGCGPELSKQDLGTVVYELPGVPKSEESAQKKDVTPSSESLTPGESNQDDAKGDVQAGQN